jgi:hypothetical protein
MQCRSLIQKNRSDTKSLIILRRRELTWCYNLVQFINQASLLLPLLFIIPSRFVLSIWWCMIWMRDVVKPFLSIIETHNRVLNFTLSLDYCLKFMLWRILNNEENFQLNFKESSRRHIWRGEWVTSLLPLQLVSSSDFCSFSPSLKEEATNDDEKKVSQVNFRKMKKLIVYVCFLVFSLILHIKS